MRPVLFADRLRELIGTERIFKQCDPADGTRLTARLVASQPFTSRACVVEPVGSRARRHVICLVGVVDMKTRVRNLGDGRQEIVRLLSLEALDRTSMDDPLTYEKSIVWLEDVSHRPYVRSKMVRGVRTRRGPLYLSGDGRVIGYSKLTADAPFDPSTNGYTRRVFYLLPFDENPGNAEAPRKPTSLVDPSTIKPGVRGERAIPDAGVPPSRFETNVSQVEALADHLSPSTESMPLD